jgi:hypothetical protein
MKVYWIREDWLCKTSTGTLKGPIWDYDPAVHAIKARLFVPRSGVAELLQEFSKMYVESGDGETGRRGGRRWT